MQQISHPNPHAYSVYEYKDTFIDLAAEEEDAEEKQVRVQLEDLVSRTRLVDLSYNSCVAQYEFNPQQLLLEQIWSLSSLKKDLDMQMVILGDRLLTVQRKIASVKNACGQSSVEVFPLRPPTPVSEKLNLPEFWCKEVYNHTRLRTLDKRKFVNPASLLGSIGQYNYTYFNNQPTEDVQIFVYPLHKSPQETTPVFKKTAPTFPIECPKNEGSRNSNVTVVHINDIIARSVDSRHIIILRGLPGSGKSAFCQAFKETELRNGHSAPRILSIDHFFMEDGKYEYDAAMEPIYRAELYKLFKRQVDEGFFSVILVDSINEKCEQFEQFYQYARANKFQPSILELKVSPTICAKRCEHKFNPMDIYKMADEWEETPAHLLKLDATSFLQDSSIEDVEMEDADVVMLDSESSSEDEVTASGFFKSKWDEDFEDRKERLDGTKQLGHEHNVFNINDFLKLEQDDLYKTGESNKTSKKQVRWADFEELKQQKRRKQLGFVAGYTDWGKIMSDDIEVAEAALVQVRYFTRDSA